LILGALFCVNEFYYFMSITAIKRGHTTNQDYSRLGRESI
jgi:hypothetical protein